MNESGLKADLVLVHGLFASPDSPLSKKKAGALREARTAAFTEYAEALGVSSYEWQDGSGRELANKMLRKMRGTAPTVDAVEIISVNTVALSTSLADKAGRELWREVASCEPHQLDATRSFVLMGAPRLQLNGPENGQKLIWFGNGLSQLSREAFITHYTTRHGPLVAGHAELIGLRRYRQVPDEQEALCASLRELGLGQAPPPATFAELVMGTPRIRLATLRASRTASREIKTDEKHHIDFSKSMLLIPGR